MNQGSHHHFSGYGTPDQPQYGHGGYPGPQPRGAGYDVNTDMSSVPRQRGTHRQALPAPSLSLQYQPQYGYAHLGTQPRGAGYDVNMEMSSAPRQRGTHRQPLPTPPLSFPYQPQYSHTDPGTQPRGARYDVNTEMNCVPRQRGTHRQALPTSSLSFQSTTQEDPATAFGSRGASSQESLEQRGIVLIDARDNLLQYPYHTKHPPIRIEWAVSSTARERPSRPAAGNVVQHAQNRSRDGTGAMMPNTAMSSTQHGKQPARPLPARQVSDADLLEIRSTSTAMYANYRGKQPVRSDLKTRNVSEADFLAIRSAASKEARASNKKWASAQVASAPFPSQYFTPAAGTDLPVFGQPLPSRVSADMLSPYATTAQGSANRISNEFWSPNNHQSTAAISNPPTSVGSSVSNSDSNKEQDLFISDEEVARLLDLYAPSSEDPTSKSDPVTSNAVAPAALPPTDSELPSTVTGDHQNVANESELFSMDLDPPTLEDPASNCSSYSSNTVDPAALSLTHYELPSTFTSDDQDFANEINFGDSVTGNGHSLANDNDNLFSAYGSTSDADVDVLFGGKDALVGGSDAGTETAPRMDFDDGLHDFDDDL